MLSVGGLHSSVYLAYQSRFSITYLELNQGSMENLVPGKRTETGRTKIPRLGQNNVRNLIHRR